MFPSASTTAIRGAAMKTNRFGLRRHPPEQPQGQDHHRRHQQQPQRDPERGVAGGHGEQYQRRQAGQKDQPQQPGVGHEAGLGVLTPFPGRDPAADQQDADDVDRADHRIEGGAGERGDQQIVALGPAQGAKDGAEDQQTGQRQDDQGQPAVQSLDRGAGGLKALIDLVAAPADQPGRPAAQ
jgi:hypothetical protein